MALQEIVERLRSDIDVSRVTLRQERPDAADEAVFPVTHESTAPGVGSIVDLETPNMAGQPVVLEVLAGNQVVQPDCVAEFVDDEPFHVMLGLYGGMRAQIVTPVVIGGATRGIVSAHELRRTREWTDSEVARCRDAVERVRAELTHGPS
ncbi:MAG: GAF domain-containing protein [Gaiellales bacterium]